MDPLGSRSPAPKVCAMMPANIGPSKSAAGRESHSQIAVVRNVIIKSETHCSHLGNFTKLKAVRFSELVEKGGMND